jgi:hypothetical protein
MNPGIRNTASKYEFAEPTGNEQTFTISKRSKLVLICYGKMLSCSKKWLNFEGGEGAAAAGAGR